MVNQRPSASQRSEPANQFLRCVGKIRAAEEAGENPAPYVAEARQWLEIVKLASPVEAATLELELKQTAKSLPAAQKPALQKPASARPVGEDTSETRLVLIRIAWVGVPFAALFMLAGPNIVVQYVSGVILVCLLAFIFIN